MVTIRRANLDSFYIREIVMVKGNLKMVKRLGKVVRGELVLDT